MKVSKMAKSKKQTPKRDNTVGGIIHPAQDRFFNKYTSAKDSIAALKEILPLYVTNWYFPPQKDPFGIRQDTTIREHFYWPIRIRLVELRKKYGANWPPVPATIPELEDWITDVDTALEKPAKEAVREKTVNASVTPPADNAESPKPRKKVKEPTKFEVQVYEYLCGSGLTETEVAEKMSKMLKRPISQTRVSRIKTHVKEWNKSVGMPDLPRPQVITNTDLLDMGPRTDGRTTGDRRHAKKIDSEGDFEN